MNFALRYAGRGSKLWSHTVSDLKHSANRVYTIVSVPIVCTRLAEWLRSETVWDQSLLPRGFDSLCISMQNSSVYTWTQCYSKAVRTLTDLIKTLLDSKKPVHRTTDPQKRPLHYLFCVSISLAHTPVPSYEAMSAALQHRPKTSPLCQNTNKQFPINTPSMGDTFDSPIVFKARHHCHSLEFRAWNFVSVIDSAKLCSQEEEDLL